MGKAMPCAFCQHDKWASIFVGHLCMDYVTKRVRSGPTGPKPMTTIPKDFRRSLSEIARSVKELCLPSQLTEVQVVARVTWKLDQAPDSLHR